MSWGTGWYGFDPASELHEAWGPEDSQRGAAVHPSLDAPEDAEVRTFMVLDAGDVARLRKLLGLGEQASAPDLIRAVRDLHDADAGRADEFLAMSREQTARHAEHVARLRALVQERTTERDALRKRLETLNDPRAAELHAATRRSAEVRS